MFWTWENFRADAPGFERDVQKTRHHPLARFAASVDALFYAATAAFIVCIIALVVS